NSGLLDDYGLVANPKPRGIFVCDMGELFGDWIPEKWQEQIFRIIEINNQHRFYLLTKQPQNLLPWSPFPENCWVGVSYTGEQESGFAYPIVHLKATVKFISFEPLLASCVKDIDSFSCSLENAGIDWVIIGACSGTIYELSDLSQKYQGLKVMRYGRGYTLQPKI
ncbi:unnamed protein product, partial [marine sediment metagenome]